MFPSRQVIFWWSPFHSSLSFLFYNFLSLRPFTWSLFSPVIFMSSMQSICYPLVTHVHINVCLIWPAFLVVPISRFCIQIQNASHPSSFIWEFFFKGVFIKLSRFFGIFYEAKYIIQGPNGELVSYHVELLGPIQKLFCSKETVSYNEMLHSLWSDVNIFSLYNYWRQNYSERIKEKITWCEYEDPGMILLCDWRGVMLLDHS